MGLLHDASVALSDIFRESEEDVAVEYWLKGTSYNISIYATIGAQTLELEPGVFSTQRTANRDFLIVRSELVFFGNVHIPEPGDRIVQTSSDGETWTYEVMEVPGEGAWRWHDDYHETYRVHVTLVKQGL